MFTSLSSIKHHLDKLEYTLFLSLFKRFCLITRCENELEPVVLYAVTELPERPVIMEWSLSSLTYKGSISEAIQPTSISTKLSFFSQNPSPILYRYNPNKPFFKTSISCSLHQHQRQRSRPEYVPGRISDPNYVRIFDTTLRDGEQSPGAALTSKEKLNIARQLAKLRVDIIEAGFPAASKDDFEAVKMIAKEVGNVVDEDGYVPVICGLSRCNEKDIKTVWEAVKYAKRPRINTFIATSDIHLEYKLRKTKQEVIEIARSMVKFARSVCHDVEFSAEDAASGRHALKDRLKEKKKKKSRSTVKKKSRSAAKKNRSVGLQRWSLISVVGEEEEEEEKEKEKVWKKKNSDENM
ncbi:hypothetical protein QYF36_007958 [Acer negundo]|nr:hypothetical protein QYF36_007958 [Acer negundo]